MKNFENFANPSSESSIRAAGFQSTTARFLALILFLYSIASRHLRYIQWAQSGLNPRWLIATIARTLE